MRMIWHWYPWAGVLRAVQIAPNTYAVLDADRLLAAQSLSWPNVWIAIGEPNLQAAQDRIGLLIPSTEALRALSLSAIAGRDPVQDARQLALSDRVVQRALRLLNTYEPALIASVATSSDIAVLEELSRLPDPRIRAGLALAALYRSFTRQQVRSLLTELRRERTAIDLGVPPVLMDSAVRPLVERFVQLDTLLPRGGGDAGAAAGVEVTTRQASLDSIERQDLLAWQDEITAWGSARFKALTACPPDKHDPLALSSILRRGRRVANTMKSGKVIVRQRPETPIVRGWKGRLTGLNAIATTTDTIPRMVSPYAEQAINWWCDLLQPLLPWIGIICGGRVDDTDWRLSSLSEPFRLEAARRLGCAQVWQTTHCDRIKDTLPPIALNRLAPAALAVFGDSLRTNVPAGLRLQWGLNPPAALTALGIWGPGKQERFRGLLRYEPEVKAEAFLAGFTRVLMVLSTIPPQAGPGTPNDHRLLNLVMHRLVVERWTIRASLTFAQELARTFRQMLQLPASRLYDRIAGLVHSLPDDHEDPTRNPVAVVLALSWDRPILEGLNFPENMVDLLAEVADFYEDMAHGRSETEPAKSRGHRRHSAKWLANRADTPGADEMKLRELVAAGASLRAIARATGRNRDWVRARLTPPTFKRSVS